MPEAITSEFPETTAAAADAASKDFFLLASLDDGTSMRLLIDLFSPLLDERFGFHTGKVSGTSHGQWMIYSWIMCNLAAVARCINGVNAVEHPLLAGHACGTLDECVPGMQDSVRSMCAKSGSGQAIQSINSSDRATVDADVNAWTWITSFCGVRPFGPTLPPYDASIPHLCWTTNSGWQRIAPSRHSCRDHIDHHGVSRHCQPSGFGDDFQEDECPYLQTSLPNRLPKATIQTGKW